MTREHGKSQDQFPSLYRSLPHSRSHHSNAGFPVPAFTHAQSHPACSTNEMSKASTPPVHCSPWDTGPSEARRTQATHAHTNGRAQSPPFPFVPFLHKLQKPAEPSVVNLALRHLPPHKGTPLSGMNRSSKSFPLGGLDTTAGKARMAKMKGGLNTRTNKPLQHSPWAAYRKRKNCGSCESSWELDFSRDFKLKKRDLKEGRRAKSRECRICFKVVHHLNSS